MVGRAASTELSAREREVLEMMARGLTNGQIAKLLCVSVHTVKFHLAASYRKLGAANRTEAAVLIRTGQAPGGAAVAPEASA
jgi:DNA-binding NarL/FixJ family response regulator